MNRFNNEERQILNQIVKNQSIQELTKENVLKDIKFARDIMDDKAEPILEMQKELLEGLVQTIETMEQTEWKELILRFPLPTVTDEEKNVEFLL